MEVEHRKVEDQFYEDAVHYWEKIPATVDGMLGGFGYISQTDIKGSHNFLQEVFRSKNPPEKKQALDCGAGIGRITKNLLIKIFDKVDLVEQNPAFLEEAKDNLKNNPRLGQLYPVGLQDFYPEAGKYDVIWCQWVMGHLKDEHFVEFLQRCKKGLKKNGIIVLKENITSSGKVEIDENDSSVTRPITVFRRLIKRSEMNLFREVQQPNLPKGLYSVKIFGLRPVNLTNSNNTKEISDNKNEIVNSENSIQNNVPNVE